MSLLVVRSVHVPLGEGRGTPLVVRQPQFSPRLHRKVDPRLVSSELV
jgi:hypothetical protein